jgi:DNA-directed RNA polymerase subunit RPC12/RpoP
VPIVYKCRNCGFTLHVFDHVGQDFYGVPSPSEIASWYGGVCPKCGHRLGVPSPDDITIRFRGGGSLLAVKRTLIFGGEAPAVEAPASQAEAGTP